MKILFVFTGGTIGSTLNGDHIAVDRRKPYLLLDAYQREYGCFGEYDAVEPYSELSENSSGLLIRELMDCVVSRLHSRYDGIIVTHGTDTLQYSAAALSYAVGRGSIPVCVVSSNYPIEDMRANGVINLHGALRFIHEEGRGGVWAVYKNKDDTVKVHRGTRLLASSAFSDSVHSIAGSYYGSFDERFTFHRAPDYAESDDELAPMPYEHLGAESANILRIEPYPGMRYPEIPDGVEYILHGSFHSGTINTGSADAGAFFRKAYERNIRVFLTGISSRIPYESTKLFDAFHIIPLTGIAPIAAYMKLWLASGMGGDIRDIMSRSLSGDILPDIS